MPRAHTVPSPPALPVEPALPERTPKSPNPNLPYLCAPNGSMLTFSLCLAKGGGMFTPTDLYGFLYGEPSWAVSEIMPLALHIVTLGDEIFIR